MIGLSTVNTSISIHAPRGGSDENAVPAPENWQISIHAPRGGSDSRQISDCCCDLISIHAPRGGSDATAAFCSACALDFNPRSPWGERLALLFSFCDRGPISIHAPRGGSDTPCTQPSPAIQISIHAPRGGSDFTTAVKSARPHNFNPRSPWGERRLYRHRRCAFCRFQSTLPVGGAT